VLQGLFGVPSSKPLVPVGRLGVELGLSAVASGALRGGAMMMMCRRLVMECGSLMVMDREASAAAGFFGLRRAPLVGVPAFV
jgi:hypothetical protein